MVLDGNKYEKETLILYWLLVFVYQMHFERHMLNVTPSLGIFGAGAFESYDIIHRSTCLWICKLTGYWESGRTSEVVPVGGSQSFWHASFFFFLHHLHPPLFPSNHLVSSLFFQIFILFLLIFILLYIFRWAVLSYYLLLISMFCFTTGLKPS